MEGPIWERVVRGQLWVPVRPWLLCSSINGLLFILRPFQLLSLLMHSVLTLSFKFQLLSPQDCAPLPQFWPGWSWPTSQIPPKKDVLFLFYLFDDSLSGHHRGCKRLQTAVAVGVQLWSPCAWQRKWAVGGLQVIPSAWPMEFLASQAWEGQEPSTATWRQRKRHLGGCG